jgi:hypothetical protein
VSAAGVRIASLGSHARRFLIRHERARVSAVFARSLHLEADDDAICLVGPELDDGALNARLAAPFVFAAIRVGDEGRNAGDAIVIGDARFDYATAADWRPPPAAWRPGFDATLARLRDMALHRAPGDGAFRPALDRDFVGETPLQRAMGERLAAFGEWLGGDAAGPPPLHGLIGLGSGLTPAGDDFVGGAVIALRARRAPRARALAAAIRAIGAGETTALSRAMLQAAAVGEGGAALHDMLAAIGSGDAPHAITLLDAIDAIGHTSGWDALAGAIVALERSA